MKYYAEIQNIFKEFEVQEVMPTTQQLKEAFNMRMKEIAAFKDIVKSYLKMERIAQNEAE